MTDEKEKEQKQVEQPYTGTDPKPADSTEPGIPTGTGDPTNPGIPTGTGDPVPAGGNG